MPFPPALKALFEAATASPAETALDQSGLLQALEQPGLEDSPLWASLKGGLGGAMRGMSRVMAPSPLELLTGAGTMGLAGVGGRAAKAAAPTMDLLESTPTLQVSPSWDDVGALLGDLRGSLAKVPQATGSFNAGAPRALQGLSKAGPPSLPPEFVPRGGEAAFNATRPAPSGVLPHLRPRGAQ